jgi:hypothetical protein
MIFEKNYKCEIYVESKFTKPYFQTIERNSEPLDLTHSYIGDLKCVQTRGGKVLYYFYRWLHNVLLYLFTR